MRLSRPERRLGAPLILLMLVMLALVVSVGTLARTASIANDSMNDLAIAWQAVQEGTVEGSELVAADRGISRVAAPATVIRDTALWTLGLAIVSFLLLIWLVVAARRIREQGSASLAGEEQREKAAVMKLMDEMAPLASGDLRVNATVTDDMTGSLADAFNYTVGELRRLVGTMATSAEQIGESVERSRLSALSVERACSDQSSETLRSSNDLLSMSAAMADLSVGATEASTAAKLAADTADEGAGALLASLQRLSSIHDEAEQTTRLMHRLADNVAAIDERVVNIQEVAKRTDLLALNTTIRASAGSRSGSASDATTDLGRLSDEVAQLADVLGQATRDIGSMTRTIAEDAALTVQSMEHTMQELVASLDQTQQANEALDTIRRHSHELRERVALMANHTVEQAGVVSQLTENMDRINSITRQTVDGVSNNADYLDELKELAVELKQGVAEFQLPSRQKGAPLQETQQVPSMARKAARRAALHE